MLIKFRNQDDLVQILGNQYLTTDNPKFFDDIEYVKMPIGEKRIFRLPLKIEDGYFWFSKNEASDVIRAYLLVGPKIEIIIAESDAWATGYAIKTYGNESLTLSRIACPYLNKTFDQLIKWPHNPLIYAQLKCMPKYFGVKV